jgi:hypothetical protein
MSTIPISLMVAQLGAFFVTRKAARRLNKKDAMDCLERHMIGDYGDVDDFDWKTNDMAWQYGFPVISSYVDRKKNRFLIITEADRSATTILLPEEY